MAEYKIEGNEYTLVSNRTTSDIAIAYAYHADDLNIKGTLFRYGDPLLVKRWYDEAVEIYNRSGLHEYANELFYVKGRIPLEHLNKCISCTGYVGKFHEMLMNGTIEIED